MDTISFYISSFLLILFCTAFVKIITTLSIFRYGLGLTSFSFGIVVFALSLALSLFVTEPYISKAGGINTFYYNNNIDFEKLDKTFRPFMEKVTDTKILDRLENLKNSKKVRDNDEPPEKPSFLTLLVAFVLSELQVAFIAGFAILIPFLLVDLLAVNILASLGVSQISASIVSLPFKLLLFFIVDGWLLLTEKLIGIYF